MPTPGCKIFKTTCATCERDSTSWTWFCDIDTSCDAKTDEFGYCEQQLGDPDDVDAENLQKQLDETVTTTAEDKAGQYSCQYDVKGTSFTQTCSETKTKTVVKGYMPNGKPIVGTTVECSTTKTEGTFTGVTADTIDMTSITSLSTTGEKTSTYTCGQDPTLTKT